MAAPAPAQTALTRVRVAHGGDRRPDGESCQRGRREPQGPLPRERGPFAFHRRRGGIAATGTVTAATAGIASGGGRGSSLARRMRSANARASVRGRMLSARRRRRGTGPEERRWPSRRRGFA